VTKYIKKEDFERIIESSIDSVGNSFTESVIMKLVTGVVTLLFGVLFVTIALFIFIGYMIVLLTAILISSPFTIAEMVIRKKT
jgi:ABC-type uncharacterized transport system fused permease/ATPase subunit